MPEYLLSILFINYSTYHYYFYPMLIRDSIYTPKVFDTKDDNIYNDRESAKQEISFCLALYFQQLCRTSVYFKCLNIHFNCPYSVASEVQCSLIGVISASLGQFSTL